MYARQLAGSREDALLLTSFDNFFIFNQRCASASCAVWTLPIYRLPQQRCLELLSVQWYRRSPLPLMVGWPSGSQQHGRIDSLGGIRAVVPPDSNIFYWWNRLPLWSAMLQLVSSICQLRKLQLSNDHSSISYGDDDYRVEWLFNDDSVRLTVLWLINDRVVCSKPSSDEAIGW